MRRSWEGWDFSLEKGEQKVLALQNPKVNIDLVLIRGH